MSDQTPNLSLPFIMPAQAQKHVTHNEAIELLDMIVQLALEATGATLPHVSPAEGQAWGLGTVPTGAWAGQAGKIATWRGGGWLFVTPRTGWIAWVKAQNEAQVMTGGVWTTFGAATGHGQIGTVLQLTPSLAPSAPTAGCVYFDSAAAKLRCYDGTLWRDLF